MTTKMVTGSEGKVYDDRLGKPYIQTYYVDDQKGKKIRLISIVIDADEFENLLTILLSKKPDTFTQQAWANEVSKMREELAIMASSGYATKWLSDYFGVTDANDGDVISIVPRGYGRKILNMLFGGE